MTLNTRLSIFFVTTLTLVLVAFSSALYGVASKYLHRQADERLEAVLNTLAAAAEIHDDGVEWEPVERKLSFGRRMVEGQLVWAVLDDQRRRLDGSNQAGTGIDLPDLTSRTILFGRPKGIDDLKGRPWRILARTLTASKASDTTSSDHRQLPRSLTFVAAVSLLDVQENLGNLALTLAGLSVVTCVLVSLVGGRLCRRALRPLWEMADAAHAIAGDDLTGRLPIRPSGDELAELGRAFNGLLDRQREAHARQSRFAGDASHQLRTPLTAIQGQVDLALRLPRQTDEYRRVLEVVQSKTRHLRRIVEALLFLARADAESEHPRLEPVNLTLWLRDHLQNRNGPRSIDLRLETEPVTSHCVRADTTLFAELLDNLLDNACKYSDFGTPIVVRADSVPGSIILSVSDFGIGIAADDLAQIAQPFYRTEQARSRDHRGLGLGLSVVRRIAEVFGGCLTVESHPGLGSTFSVRLPIAEISPEVVDSRS